LFTQGRCSEVVYYTFDSELDLQQDALEYPEVYERRGYKKGGFVHTLPSYRKRLIQLRRTLSRFPFLKNIFPYTEEDLITERYQLLRVRLFTSYAVVDYLDDVKKLLNKPEFKHVIKEVKDTQMHYMKGNQKEIKMLEEKYPSLVTDYQKRIITSLIGKGPRFRH